jgi:hypothetical protein
MYLCTKPTLQIFYQIISDIKCEKIKNSEFKLIWYTPMFDRIVFDGNFLRLRLVFCSLKN